MDPDTVKEELESMGYTSTYSVSLLLTWDKFPINSFLVKLRKIGSLETICSLKSFLYIRVQVHSFNVRSGPPQCYSCQRYRLCVRCGEEHRGGCRKSREVLAKCCNCAGSHPSNYHLSKGHSDSEAPRQRPKDRSVSQERCPETAYARACRVRFLRYGRYPRLNSMNPTSWA